jgi:RNA recognition motif-containing protein
VAISNSSPLNSPGVELQSVSISTFNISNLRSTANKISYSESTSIPKNPRTDRPVGYAFVDLSTPSEAERAIAELSGKEILDRKVSVQLARTPEPAGEKGEGATSGGEGVSGGEGGRRRPSGRGRGRGRGRGGRGGRAARGVSLLSYDVDIKILTCQ